MKKVIPIFIFFLLAPLGLQAATFGWAQEYTLLQGETVKSDLYAAGGTAALVGNVIGDASIAGGNIFVGDMVSQNANLIGGGVDVVGSVGGNLRIVSGKSLVRATVGGDLVSASGNIQLLPDSVITGDVDMAAGSAILDGEIKGDVKGIAGSVTLNGIIRGSVHITADKVTIGPKAEIDGSLIYFSSQQTVIPSTAIVKGQNVFTQMDTRSRAEKLLPTLWGTWILIKFIILLVSALVIQGIFRSISTTLVRTALDVPVWSIVRGFLVLVAVPLALLLVLLTFIGIPFVVLGGAVYVLFMVLAYLFSPVVLGSLVWKIGEKSHSIVVNWKSIVIGVCVFMIISTLGWFGLLFESILFLLTLGAIYHVLFERFVRARE